MGKHCAKHYICATEYMRILEAINSATTIEGLKSNVLGAIEINRMSYHHFASVGAFDFQTLGRYFAYNMPELATDYYDKRISQRKYPSIGPIFAKGQAMWHSDLIKDPTYIEKGFLNQGQGFMEKAGDGLGVPLYGPNNRYGYLFISFHYGKKDVAKIFVPQIQALAQIAHVRYCLLLKTVQKQVNLTGRESEVLELISFGKTNSEIAAILNISSNTVAGYVKSIFIKLDVSDRVSAAMRAQTIRAVF